jgi:hypothetical protein
MESCTLESTFKIDFRCSTTTAHLKGFQRKYHVSEQLWNSIPNSCSSQCPGASIYRLGAQMRVKQNIARRCPNDGHGSSGRTTVRQDFLKISWGNLSCIRASSGQDAHCPDRRMSTASNFLIRLSASRPWVMNVRTAIRQHAISISAMCTSEP